MAREAIAMVASGASPRIAVAGIRHGQQILDSAQKLALEAGVRVKRLPQPDETGVRSGGRTDLRMTDDRRRREPRRLGGRRPGDRRVRVDRPHALFFRYAAASVASSLGSGFGAAHSCGSQPGQVRDRRLRPATFQCG